MSSLLKKLLIGALIFAAVKHFQKKGQTDAENLEDLEGSEFDGTPADFEGSYSADTEINLDPLKDQNITREGRGSR